jgi:hypothetical protein
MWLKVDVIKQKLVNEIECTIWTKHSCLQNKEHIVKHKCCHPKEEVKVKLSHLVHLPNMMAKFEQEKGH